MTEEPIVFTARFLKQSGLLEKRNKTLLLSFKNVAFIITSIDGSSQLDFVCFGGCQASFSVRHKIIKLKFGYRPFFINEDHLQYCFIVFYHGRFYDGPGFVDFGPPLGKVRKRHLLGTARRREKFWIPEGASKRFISSRTSAAYRTLASDDIEHLPAETRRHFAQQQDAIMPFSTGKEGVERHKGPEYAVRHRRDLPSESLNHLSETSPAEYARRCHQKAELPQFSAGSVDGAFEITAAALNSARLLVRGQLKAFYAGWDFDENISEAMLFLTDLRDPDRPRVLIEYSSTAEFEGRWQSAMLERAANLRWYFRCPMTARRCGSLFIRDGYLGSREALNLTSHHV